MPVGDKPHGEGGRLRIAVVHSFYSSDQPSGENNVVRTHVEALQRWGHEVRLISTQTDQERTRLAFSVRAGLRVATGLGNNPGAEIKQWRPDLVYVHNLFPNFGRCWALGVEVPIVAVLHNYRPLCANGMLLRNGRVCTLCPDGRRWAGVRYACYRASRTATLPIAWANRRGPAGNALLQAAARIIVLSPRQRDVFARAGVSTEKMAMIPNFLPDDLDPGMGDETMPRAGWVFVGRLSEEKGLRDLVRHWPPDIELQIVGAGPLESEVRALSRGKPIDVLGRRPREEVVRLMRSARGVVFPSLWFEGCPLVYVEALACGTPVLAVGPSVVGDLAESEGTGARAEWSDLPKALRHLEQDFTALNTRCRSTFEARYSEVAFRRRLDELHADLNLVP